MTVNNEMAHQSVMLGEEVQGLMFERANNWIYNDFKYNHDEIERNKEIWFIYSKFEKYYIKLYCFYLKHNLNYNEKEIKKEKNKTISYIINKLLKIIEKDKQNTLINKKNKKLIPIKIEEIEQPIRSWLIELAYIRNKSIHNGKISTQNFIMKNILKHENPVYKFYEINAVVFCIINYHLCPTKEYRERFLESTEEKVELVFDQLY
jgi:hypothetical protein